MLTNANQNIREFRGGEEEEKKSMQAIVVDLVAHI